MRSWTHRAASLLPLAFLLLGAVYAVVTPVWEAPDEPAHFSYAADLARGRGLPVQRPGELGVAHHPPLYYLMAAAVLAPLGPADDPVSRPNPRFVWAGNGGHDVNAVLHGSAESFPYRGGSLALHLVRLLGVVLGAATVALVVRAARVLCPERPWVALAAGAVVAFNPQFLFIAASADNEVLAALGGAGVVHASLSGALRPSATRPWLRCGLWLVVALLAKETAVMLAPVALACAFWTGALRSGLGGAVRRAAAVAGPVAVGAGWWAARNTLLYGDPVGYRGYRAVWGAYLETVPLGDVPDVVLAQFRSFWGVLGWMNVPLPGWVLAGAALLCLAGAAGCALAVLRPWPGPAGDRARVAVAVLAAFAASAEVLMLGVALVCGGSCYQGRYLFPAVAAVGLLLGLGLVRLAGTRWRGAPVMGVVGAFAGTAVCVPPLVLAPAYPHPAQPSWTALLAPARAGVAFGDAAELVGYDYGVEKGAARVRLCWQAGARQAPYSAFVHLTDGDGRVLGQQDHVPGHRLGYPLGRWEAGDVVWDEHVIPVPEGSDAGHLRFKVGLYDWNTGVRLPARTIRTGGQRLADDAAEFPASPTPSTLRPLLDLELRRAG